MVEENLFLAKIICKEPFKKSAKQRSLGFPSFDVRRTRRFFTHFEPYDHRRTSKNERRNAKIVAL